MGLINQILFVIFYVINDGDDQIWFQFDGPNKLFEMNTAQHF